MQNSQGPDAAAPAAAIGKLWHTKTAAAALAELESCATGLTSARAAELLRVVGPNALAEKPRPTFLERLWDQLNNALTWILLGAAVVAGAFLEWVEFGLILGVVSINVAIGMIQEGKAEDAAEAIKSMLSPKCVVLRDGGSRSSLESKELVPGDVIFLQPGDCVPADARLLDCTGLATLESMLTGESLPVSKNAAEVYADQTPLGDRKNCVFAGTLVMRGQGAAVVVATGDASQLGRINSMVNSEEDEQTHLQEQLERFGRFIGGLTLVVGVASFFLARFSAGVTWAESFIVAVAIAVAMIPEGLPAVVTITLALGMGHMASKQAIVRKLPAVETLGSVTVICSDKTGTLTKNEMTAVRVVTRGGAYPVTGVGYNPLEGSLLDRDDGAPLNGDHLARLRAILLTGLLANDGGLKAPAADGGQWTIAGDPTDAAPLVLSRKTGVADHVAEAAAYPRVACVPFESEHKYMASLNTHGNVRVMHLKGAFERVLPMCVNELGPSENVNAVDAAPIDAAFWRAQALAMASQGLRVLAYARWTAPADFNAAEGMSVDAFTARPAFLTLLCLVGIMDPPRPECRGAIAEAHTAGITVKMITGDSPDTARSIAFALDIVTRKDAEAITGAQLDALVASGDAEALRAAVERCNVFARVSPENKIQIVKALKAADNIVSMTGDGVNDAPALKAADIGVAMGITGTDVSKEAAKIVLADDNFCSIVEAVREGRRVWDNLRKIMILNVAANLAQGLAIFGAFVIGSKYAPLTAVGVLYINMIVSVTVGLTISFEPAEEDIMFRPPRLPSKPLNGKLFLWRTAWISIVLMLLIIGNFQWSLNMGHNLARARTVAFNLLVIASCMYAANCRFLRASSLHPRVFVGNPTMWISISIMVVFNLIITYVPGLNARFFMCSEKEYGFCSYTVMDGEDWARVIGFSLALFLLVEFEKWSAPWATQHIVKPLFAALGCKPTEQRTFYVRDQPQSVVVNVAASPNTVHS